VRPPGPDYGALHALPIFPDAPFLLGAAVMQPFLLKALYIRKRMEQAKKRLATLDVVMSRLYEDYALGEIRQGKVTRR